MWKDNLYCLSYLSQARPEGTELLKDFGDLLELVGIIPYRSILSPRLIPRWMRGDDKRRGQAPSENGAGRASFITSVRGGHLLPAPPVLLDFFPPLRLKHVFLSYMSELLMPTTPIRDLQASLPNWLQKLSSPNPSFLTLAVNLPMDISFSTFCQFRNERINHLVFLAFYYIWEREALPPHATIPPKNL